MKSDKIKVIPLQEFTTGEGSMFPIYRDWDPVHEGYVPKMVYATTMNPGTTKGPILHLQRDEFVTAISGQVDVEFLIGGVTKVYTLRNEEGSNILKISAGIAKRFINRSNDIAVIVNLPSKSWHPDNEDTFKFKNWKEYETFIKK